MTSTLPQPIPKNLREQMMSRLSTMDDKRLARLHELDLLAEKLELREEMSRQAEAEQARGAWDGLAEVIRAYRMRNRTS